MKNVYRVAIIAILSVATGCAQQVVVANTQQIGNISTPQHVEEPSQIVEQAAVTTKKIETPSIRLVFTGDVMLGRHVGTLIRRNGLQYPFRNITLKNPDGKFPADMLIINLEGAINGDDPKCTTCMSFSFADSVAGELARQGVTMATLANNHGLDKGDAGYQRTRKLLKEAGVTPFGKLHYVGDDSVTIKIVQGKRIGYIGLVVFPPFDEAKAKTLIQKTRSQVDWLFVVVHWGNEYQVKENAMQEKLAHTWIDAGADAIIGHHPHVVQPVEVYKGKPIFYSLGNTIFDQYWSDATQRGMLVGLTLQNGKITWQTWKTYLPKAQPKVVQ